MKFLRLNAKKAFDQVGKPTQAKHTYHRNTFLGALSENPGFRVSCGRVERTPQNVKKHARDNFIHMPTPPHLWRPPHFACGSDDGRNQMCQISSESFQGFRSPKGLKFTLLHSLGTSPLQQCI